MTIKEAAERTGISIDNLRYYERIGLFPEIPRSSSGMRDYDEMSLHWIDFAMRFKRGGMSLEAIRDDSTGAAGRSYKAGQKRDLAGCKKRLGEKND
ncbi:MerR family transcriptional regulator [Acetobacterium malicum]|uniref:MerR family transcriptional regulator n=1 Tax=Acetobacterium malicum TaxID=52692 RepID=UPI001FAE0433|nr:MerR family transcriptional regulator [Acetobacterium malicum]